MKINTFDGKQQEKEPVAHTKYTTETHISIMTNEGVKWKLWKSKPKKTAKEVVACMFAATNLPQEWEDMTMVSELEESGTEVLQMLDMDIED